MDGLFADLDEVTKIFHVGFSYNIGLDDERGSVVASINGERVRRRWPFTSVSGFHWQDSASTTIFHSLNLSSPLCLCLESASIDL